MRYEFYVVILKFSVVLLLKIICYNGFFYELVSFIKTEKLNVYTYVSDNYLVKYKDFYSSFIYVYLSEVSLK